MYILVKNRVSSNLHSREVTGSAVEPGDRESWGGGGPHCKRMVLEGFAHTMTLEQPEEDEEARHGDIWG